MGENVSWHTQLITAIIAFVGVIVGGFVNGAVTYWIEVRKEQVEAKRDKAARANELRTAARLILDEFMVARSVATGTWKSRKMFVSSDTWQTNKGILARQLPFDDWKEVFAAGVVVEKLDQFKSDDVFKEDNPAIRAIDSAIEVLRQYQV